MRWRVHLRRLRRNEQIVLAILALAIGFTAAVGAIAFREGIDLVQRIGFGFSGELVATQAGQLPWWQIILVPTLGGLLVGLLVKWLMPRGRPEGVAHVIEAAALHGGRMSARAGFGAAVVSCVSLGVGASAGREGPVVHLGASLSALLARTLKLSPPLSRTLLGCGVASAVAASFNAPIAGVFFALEVVIGHYALRAFAPIVIASVTGTICSRMYFGDFPAFIIPNHEITSFFEFPAFALLGVTSAVVAVIFMRSVAVAETMAARLPGPIWYRPAVAGLVVGALAIAFPQILGVGYEATDGALNETLSSNWITSGFWLAVALIAAKTAATAICLGAGFGGGVFSPSLFLGAMVGCAFGMVATWLFPDLSSGHSAYTLIGMGALAGAVLGAPISTILMIFELTGDYELTIAVMVATVIATLLTQAWFGRSFFSWQLEQRGIELHHGREGHMLRSTTVGELMHEDMEVVRQDAPLSEVRDQLRRSPMQKVFVTNQDGCLIGTITLHDLDDLAFDTSKDANKTAEDFAFIHAPVLAVDDDVDTAIKMFARLGHTCVPVVDDRSTMRLVGSAWEHDVMVFATETLTEVRREERG